MFRPRAEIQQPLLAALLCFFAAFLWQVKVDEAKTGGSWMRLVNPNDAVLMKRASANFVIRGGVCVAANLYVTAGEPAAGDSEGANRFAVITLEHLPVMGERLAIEGQNLRRRVAGHVIDRPQAEVGSPGTRGFYYPPFCRSHSERQLHRSSA
jgi:hypothetical protein